MTQPSQWLCPLNLTYHNCYKTMAYLASLCKICTWPVKDVGMPEQLAHKILTTPIYTYLEFNIAKYIWATKFGWRGVLGCWGGGGRRGPRKLWAWRGRGAAAESQLWWPLQRQSVPLAAPPACRNPTYGLKMVFKLGVVLGCHSGNACSPDLQFLKPFPPPTHPHTSKSGRQCENARFPS